MDEPTSSFMYQMEDSSSCQVLARRQHPAILKMFLWIQSIQRSSRVASLHKRECPLMRTLSAISLEISLLSNSSKRVTSASKSTHKNLNFGLDSRICRMTFLFSSLLREWPLSERVVKLVNLVRTSTSMTKISLSSRLRETISLAFSWKASTNFRLWQYLMPHSEQCLVNLLLNISILLFSFTYSASTSESSRGFPLTHKTFKSRYCILLMSSSSLVSWLPTRDKVTVLLGNSRWLSSVSSIESNSISVKLPAAPMGLCSSSYPGSFLLVFWYLSISRVRGMRLGFSCKTRLRSGYLKVRACSMIKTAPDAGISVLALKEKVSCQSSSMISKYSPTSQMALDILAQSIWTSSMGKRQPQSWAPWK